MSQNSNAVESSTFDKERRVARVAKLGVVIPLANETETVVTLLSRITVQLMPQDSVFCVLDNASKDDTRSSVEQFGEQDPRVVCVWAPENRCVVDAYFRGYREALADQCDWILEMDGGLSHVPEEIPQFVAAMEAGNDYVGGSRFIAGGQHGGPLSRYLLSRIGTVLANLLLGTQMSDMTSGYECFSRRALTNVVEHGVRSRAHFFQTEIRYWMHRYRWVEVPITYTNASPRVGRQNILDAITCLVGLWKSHRSKQRSAEGA